MRARFSLGSRSISYLDTGAGTAVPTGDRVLVLLHAFPLAATMWLPQMEAVPAGWRFVAPDLAGFGESEDLPGEPSIDDYAVDFVALVDHLRLAEVAVAGLSMGGYAAFAVLRRAPERVRALVLADTRPQADTEEGRAARLAMLARIRGGGVAAVAEDMIPRLLSAATRAEMPSVEREVRALIEANRADGVRAGVRRIMGRPDSTALVRGLEMPVLVINGEEDAVTPVAAVREMHGMIAGSSLVIIPGAGHLSNLERPDTFNSALASFLAS
ncbi:MAG: alpha/beta fold hydrolase [Acidobacteria bacterium]|nr:MAG: alpha/beta fold hydrolase [Acidobacteriota bacterium]